MNKKEAIDILNDERIVIWTEPDEEEEARKQNEAIDMAIEALNANNVEYDDIVKISVTDRNKEKVVLCDAFGEVEYYPTKLYTHEEAWGICDLISRAGVSAWLSNMGHDKLACAVMDIRRFPPADIPTKCIAQINIDTDEIVKRIKNEYEIVDKPIGEWIPRPYEIDYENDAECSICGEIVIDGNGYSYCPNCGIKMKSKKEEK